MIRKISASWGRYQPAGSNDRAILPTVEWQSTGYMENVDRGDGVQFYRGILFRWWSLFFCIRYNLDKKNV
jgi:hypothetical protein